MSLFSFQLLGEFEKVMPGYLFLSFPLLSNLPFSSSLPESLGHQQDGPAMFFCGALKGQYVIFFLPTAVEHSL